MARGRILKIKYGYNPNSSSVGSETSGELISSSLNSALNATNSSNVTSAIGSNQGVLSWLAQNSIWDVAKYLISAAIAGVLIYFTAKRMERIIRKNFNLDSDSLPPLQQIKVRYEPFGGVISVSEPPALVFVDKEFLKSLGGYSPVWEDGDKGHLSAPTEVHFSITNKCQMNCPSCYVSAGSKLDHEMSYEELKKTIDVLSGKGIFHIAFGGGEPTTHPDLFRLAEYARSKGIVPNITTNGVGITEDMARKFKVFEQIHVSLDGFGEYYKAEGSNKTFEEIDEGVRLLRRYNGHVGLNVVMNRDNFDQLEDLARYAEERRLEGILLLRYKPSGRAKQEYQKKKLSWKQQQGFYDLLMKLHEKYKIKVCLDCSCVPFFSSREIDLKVLEFFSVTGCDAGNILVGVSPDGRLNACSFCEDANESVMDLDKEWDKNTEFSKFRNWTDKPKEPCRSCKYLKICRGGCHVVAKHVTGDFYSPDPECPTVIAYNDRFIGGPNLVDDYVKWLSGIFGLGRRNKKR